jgi:hypothetical protein
MKSGNASVTRLTPVVTGDFESSWYLTDSAFYFTKSEVKGKIENIKETLGFTGQKPRHLCIFTPDPGITATATAPMMNNSATMAPATPWF